VLIFSGWRYEFPPGSDKYDPDFIEAVERFDPDTNSIARLARSANKQIDLYPRMHVMPDGRLFRAGPENDTQYFDASAARWVDSAVMDYGYRSHGASVLLPGLTEVLALGGSKHHGATSTAEIIDLGAAEPSWRTTQPMSHARKHLNAVLLADGTVLVTGGGRKGEYGRPVKVAELFDPVTETWTTAAAQQAPRAYHSTALLLPDGRVLSAGHDNGRRATKAEIYSPPYLFRGPRPTIASTSEELTYGGGFEIATPDAADIGRVALVKPGSVTHGVNFDQRYVDVGFVRTGDATLSVTAPSTPEAAPPGYYMLFIVNSLGVPSEAAWVHLS
jgi:hypothetical protein